MLAIRHTGIIAVSLGWSSLACGQWSDDPAVNTLVSGGEAGCVITHTAATPNGHVWVAWYDSSSGYDVRLQRLDETGASAFDPPILISDQSLSWVQDFDLACDASGRAAIVWANETLIGAALVEHDGDLAWAHEFGAGSGAFLGSPQVCGTDDGAVVVGWMQDAPSHFQRLEADGSLAWPSEIVIDDGGTTAVSDIKAGLDGSVVVSLVHYISFTGAKRLKTQRLSASGATMWGLGPVDVFTSGSLQFGAYPEFISDGNGGGIFSWYETSPLMARLQWVDGDGVVRWGSNGFAVTNETSMVHVSPWACLDPSSGETTVFWVRQSGNQSTAGVQANRFNADAAPLWGSSGQQIVMPSSSYSILDLQAAQVGPFATAAWLRDSQTGSDTVFAAAVDAMGDMQWGFAPTSLGTSVGAKTDLSCSSQGGQLVACWSDDRDGVDRVYAQNIHEDGTLGPSVACQADVTGDGVVGTDDLLSLIGLWGPCEGCPEDISGDGMVGADDLLFLISLWGPC